MSTAEVILLAASSGVAFPILVLLLEVAMACISGYPRDGTRGAARDSASPRRPVRCVAVLIPAHNEEPGIARTISAIRSQLAGGDRLLVVAHNCTDATASVARAAGAEVIERVNNSERGKGYALAAGIAHLAQCAPEVVVVVDADTLPDPGVIAALASDATRFGRPVQGVYLMVPPTKASPRSAISAFAFCLKNQVRSIGAQRLQIPAHLNGTGMAFPWAVLCKANLATDNIVEDMQLGVDLAVVGHPPMFSPSARFSGTLPGQATAARTQRTRWEHGHLKTILHNVPRLLWIGVRQRRPSLVALSMDLAVPPLALLTLLWAAMAVAAAACALAGIASMVPLGVLLGYGTMLAVGVLAAWVRFARRILPLSALAAVPLYVLSKIPIYLALICRPQRTWERTPRI